MEEDEKLRWFRATFYDAATPDRNIVIEFKAPFPVDVKKDYKNIAIKQFINHLNVGYVKVRDIAPVEV